MALSRDNEIKAAGKGGTMLAEFWLKFTAQVQERGGTFADLHRLAQKPEGEPIIRQMAELLVRGENASAVSRTGKIEAALSKPYPTTVNYGRSPKTMAKAGKYPDGYNSYYDDMKWSEWKAPDGSKLIVPKRGTVKKELRLFHLGAYFGNDHFPTSKEVSTVLVEHGLVVEIGQTVPALGAKYPELGTKFPVIALGSVWFDPGGRRHVAVRWHDAGERDLGLRWVSPGGQWGPDDRVLVSRA